MVDIMIITHENSFIALNTMVLNLDSSVCMKSSQSAQQKPCKPSSYSERKYVNTTIVLLNTDSLHYHILN